MSYTMSPWHHVLSEGIHWRFSFQYLFSYIVINFIIKVYNSCFERTENLVQIRIGKLFICQHQYVIEVRSDKYDGWVKCLPQQPIKAQKLHYDVMKNWWTGLTLEYVGFIATDLYCSPLFAYTHHWLNHDCFS